MTIIPPPHGSRKDPLILWHEPQINLLRMFVLKAVGKEYNYDSRDYEEHPVYKIFLEGRNIVIQERHTQEKSNSDKDYIFDASKLQPATSWEGKNWEGKNIRAVWVYGQGKVTNPHNHTPSKNINQLKIKALQTDEHARQIITMLSNMRAFANEADPTMKSNRALGYAAQEAQWYQEPRPDFLERLI